MAEPWEEMIIRTAKVSTRIAARETYMAKVWECSAIERLRDSEWIEAGRAVREVEYQAELAATLWRRAAEEVLVWLLDAPSPTV